MEQPNSFGDTLYVVVFEWNDRRSHRFQLPYSLVVEFIELHQEEDYNKRQERFEEWRRIKRAPNINTGFWWLHQCYLSIQKEFESAETRTGGNDQFHFSWHDVKIDFMIGYSWESGAKAEEYIRSTLLKLVPKRTWKPRPSDVQCPHCHHHFNPAPPDGL